MQKNIDSIVIHAIGEQAFPGCVVHASYKGAPLISKAYGHHTYDSLSPVYLSDIYDLASVTKVMASTLALMKLYEEGKLSLDEPLSTYVDGIKWRRMGKATLRECLTHQAGLRSWMRFYEEIKRGNGKYQRKTISSTPSADYPYQIAEDMYLHRDFYRKIKTMIKKSRVMKKNAGYLYSDFFFYLVPEIVEALSGMPFEAYLEANFYHPLRVPTLSFNPAEEFPIGRIVPTEIDTFFRHQPIRGKVHDEGAILMQGISGNAGLFGAAEDVARLWQMLMDQGTYDSVQYLHPATVELFTSYQYPANGNRRALGFDKPLLEYDPVISSIAREASIYSYGHTGYTGTLVWADPSCDLLFVFLSNRVYPTRNQKAIYELNVRPEIHQLLYDYVGTVGDN